MEGRSQCFQPLLWQAGLAGRGLRWGRGREWPWADSRLCFCPAPKKIPSSPFFRMFFRVKWDVTVAELCPKPQVSIKESVTAGCEVFGYHSV